MQTKISVMMMVLGMIQQANAAGFESVLAVSECKPYQRIQAKFAGIMDTYSYNNYRLSAKVCDYNFQKQKYEVIIHTTVIDLGIFEDNDNLQVTANLKERCEALREEALGEVVNQNETPCRVQNKVTIPLIK